MTMINRDDINRAAILIVDDQPVNVQLLEFLLKGTGYTNVHSTTNPREVAPLHEQHHYDLIILDLHMPGMSGFEVMKEIEPMELESYLPVLVVTAEPDKKLAALEAGARDFVTKPFDPVEVLSRVKNMLEVRLLHRESRNYGTLLEQTVRERTAELQRFRSAMDATEDAIFLIDTGSMKVVDLNDGACRMLGYRREQLLALDPTMYGLAQSSTLIRQDDPGRDKGEDKARDPSLVDTELTRADMTTVPVEIYWQVRTVGATRMLIAVARDITERIETQERLKRLAGYDSLTGLPNRALFYRTLSETIEEQKGSARHIAILVIALDRFKTVNDSLGAHMGDELLREFSKRLVRCVRIRDTAGRLGGNEFSVILTMARSQQDAANVANEVREALRTPFELAGQQVVLTASIGIAMYPEDATEPETLIRYADTAMGRAKQAGRDGYRFFTASMNAQVLARLDLELALRHALEHNEFCLHYQPKVDLATGRISGAEALLRWDRPERGTVYPAEFVPILEETGMIVRAGTWIIDEACRQIAAWQREGVGDVRVAVNVSSRQFVEGDIELEIRRALDRHQIDAALLELELTESALMANAEHTVEVLTNLKQLGIRVAIDDFGTGYSSLAYLKRFPIDKLKIDIAFVRDVTVNPDDAAIALAIISMAHSLKMQVIAEGVESSAQQAYLRRNRCDEMQGFHFSRPLPAKAMGDLALANREQPVERESEQEQRPTLLLVDDDKTVLAALHRLFRNDGYRILSAGSPHEGFELLALYPVQVILCDQRMPDMSGTDFLARVKEMYPETVRIILSGYTGVEQVVESVNRGAIFRYFTKPWVDAELRDNVRQAFRHQRRQVEQSAGGAPGEDGGMATADQAAK
jgi:diguanylate cyclase (GGDEF)-like protein/PAS domain S-box-containing protein